MKKGLKNPAVISAVASSPQGQKAIGDALNNANETIATTRSIAKNLFWLTVIVGTGYVGYKVFVNRFSALKYDNTKPKARISMSTAKAKADSIYKAMYGLGNGFAIVAKNLKGLSYNDFVMVYNEFGGRKGINDVFQRMNMIEWFTDQFNSAELLRLRFLVPNFF